MRAPLFSALTLRRAFLRRSPLARHGGIASCGLALCVALAWGCSKQAEGERCDVNNGDLDCDDGLQCRPESQLSIRGTPNGALCCPVLTEPTVDACRGAAMLPPETTTPGTGTTVDAGHGETPVNDAGSTPDAGDAGATPDAGDAGP